MKFGWVERTHDRITIKAISPIKELTDSDKAELVEYVREPDRLLPLNLKNHVQDMSGYGNAKNKIIEEFNKGTLRGLGHAIHYIQDLCNPIHTVKDYPITKHIAYELEIKDEEIGFVPDGKFVLFKDGLENGIEKVVNISIDDSRWLIIDIEYRIFECLRAETRRALKRAAYATYELVNLWLSSQSH
jgi:hypothetical protein